VTLARRVAGDQIEGVLAAVGSVPIAGQASGLRVWDAGEKTVTTLR
jgi:hypothetical protein